MILWEFGQNLPLLVMASVLALTDSALTVIAVLKQLPIALMALGIVAIIVRLAMLTE